MDLVKKAFAVYTPFTFWVNQQAPNQLEKQRLQAQNQQHLKPRSQQPLKRHLQLQSGQPSKQHLRPQSQQHSKQHLQPRSQQHLIQLLKHIGTQQLLQFLEQILYVIFKKYWFIRFLLPAMWNSCAIINRIQYLSTTVASLISTQELKHNYDKPRTRWLELHVLQFSQ